MLYGMFKRGFLPDKGGVVDQSNVLLAAFRVLDDANAEADKVLEEADRKKQARGNRSAHGPRRRR